MARERFESSDPVEEILRIAIRNSGGGTDATLRERLLASASELGISEEAVLQAQKVWEEQRKEQDLFEEYRAQVKQEFWTHAGVYVVVNVLLIIINALTSHYPWAIWPILAWGIGFGCHAVVTFQQLRNRKSPEFEAWQLRKEGKLLPNGASRHGRVTVGIHVGQTPTHNTGELPNE